MPASFPRDGTERRVPVSQLSPGDRFVVRPGEAIAADGVVEFGESAVDTAMMTGEPVPADVAEGAMVTAGTVVVAGRLVVRAIRTGDDTQLAHLIALVERAQAEKSAVQRLADRICGVFVPVVLAAAALTLAGWLLAGGPAGAGVQRGAGRADHRLPVRARAGDARLPWWSPAGAARSWGSSSRAIRRSRRPAAWTPSCWTRPAPSRPASWPSPGCSSRLERSVRCCCAVRVR